jgi:hypothetical protein
MAKIVLLKIAKHIIFHSRKPGTGTRCCLTKMFTGRKTGKRRGTRAL